MKQKNFFRKQNIAVRALLLLMIVWTIWIIGSAITGLVRDIFVQSEEVHYATMEHVESGYGMLALTEHVIYAELDGTAELVIAEGDRVRKGNAVFRIGETYQYTNFAGRVSYRIDGLENITDIGTISALNMKEYYNAQQKKQKNTAVAGDAYAKVQETMNGLSLYVFVEKTDRTAELGIGQTVKVKLLDIGEYLKGEVVEVLNTADGIRCMKLEIGLANTSVYQQRVYQIELPYNSERVLVIPEKALAKKGGVDGVYYLHKGFVFWKEVSVSDRWIEQGVLVVEEGLEEGDIIVTTPKFVREGENIKF